MCPEVLSRLIGKEEQQGKLHSIKISRNASAITHLIYADNLLLMGRANKTEADAFIGCFETYCKWLGQEENFEKSNILFQSPPQGKIGEQFWKDSSSKKWEQILCIWEISLLREKQNKRV